MVTGTVTVTVTVTVTAIEDAPGRGRPGWADTRRRLGRLYERSVIVVGHEHDHYDCVDERVDGGDDEHRVDVDVNDIDDGCTVNDVGVNDNGRRANDQRCACTERDDDAVGHHHEPHGRRAPAVGTVHRTGVADCAHC